MLRERRICGIHNDYFSNEQLFYTVTEVKLFYKKEKNSYLLSVNTDPTLGDWQELSSSGWQKGYTIFLSENFITTSYLCLPLECGLTGMKGACHSQTGIEE